MKSAKQQKKSKKTKSSGGVVSNGVASEGKKVGGVNEQKVDLLLDMLKSADVTQTSQEEDKTIQELEREGRREGRERVRGRSERGGRGREGEGGKEGRGGVRKE